jgi:hypothetical protein
MHVPEKTVMRRTMTMAGQRCDANIVMESDKDHGVDFDIVLNKEDPSSNDLARDLARSIPHPGGDDEIDGVFNDLLDHINKVKNSIEIIDVQYLEPPKTTINNAGSISSFDLLDPAIGMDDQFTSIGNPIIENALIIVLDGYIEVLQNDNNDGTVSPTIIAMLKDLHNIMLRKDKRAIYQKYEELADNANASNHNELKAFLMILGRVYFSKVLLY